MEIAVRNAAPEDIAQILALYRAMEAEQTERKPVWALTDGLDEPFEASVLSAITGSDSWVYVGEIDGVVVGFVWALLLPMLDRAGGERIGRLQLIYTDPEARGVGVGHQLAETALAAFRSLGVRHFEAPVGPGQRAAKNFFEGHRFAARSIVMYSEDRDSDD
ncbi:MAG: GNAT family N-acetyltransferase [Acidimicrobiia bacterium]